MNLLRKRRDITEKVLKVGEIPNNQSINILMICVIIGSYDANGIEVYPKVILITDGKPTETGLIAGPDVTSPSTDQEVVVYNRYLLNIVKIYFVFTALIESIPN